MSEAEHLRGMKLLMMQQAGTISRLRFQPRYELVVNGQKIGVYVADCEYLHDGKMVTEDTKPEKFMDDLAKLKIRLFQAIYGVTVKVPQRKSGTIADAPKTPPGRTLL